MSEEEIINILKTNIDCLKNPKPFIYSNNEKINAIEGLLDLYNKEKEKNTSLIDSLTRRIEYTNELESIKLRLTIENNKLQNSIQEYISKDKIKEKIEEIDEEDLGFNDLDYLLESGQKGYAIAKLKELLEE